MCYIYLVFNRRVRNNCLSFASPFVHLFVQSVLCFSQARKTAQTKPRSLNKPIRVTEPLLVVTNSQVYIIITWSLKQCAFHVHWGLALQCRLFMYCSLVHLVLEHYPFLTLPTQRVPLPSTFLCTQCTDTCVTVRHIMFPALSLVTLVLRQTTLFFLQTVILRPHKTY